MNDLDITTVNPIRIAAFGCRNMDIFYVTKAEEIRMADLSLTRTPKMERFH